MDKPHILSSLPSELHAFLASKMSLFLSWIAAMLGLGTFIGLVNVLVGVLSAVWLAVQLWNYFTFTLPSNRKKLKEFRQIRAVCPKDNKPLDEACKR